MSNNNCAICLESLCTGPIGFTHPCGHVFHRECYNGWALSRASHVSSNTSASTRTRNQDDEIQIKCPMCSRPVCATHGFTHVFLDLKNDDDDISISDDDDDDDDDDNNDDSNSNSNMDNECGVSSVDAVDGQGGNKEDDGGDDESDNDSIDLTNPKESCDAIIIGDSDDDDDDDFTIMGPPTSIDTSTSTPGPRVNRRTSSSTSSSIRLSSSTSTGTSTNNEHGNGNGNSTTHSEDFTIMGPPTSIATSTSTPGTRVNRRTSSSTSSTRLSSSTCTGTSTNDKHGNGNSTTHSGNADITKMEKKYKKVKRQLKHAKVAANEYQKMKAQSDQWKEIEEDLREELIGVSRRESKYKRELNDCKELLDSTLGQVVILEDELKSTKDSYHSKVRALEQNLHHSKASSMQEIKEITARDKELVTKYEQLVKLARDKDKELQQLEKQNASLKRRLFMGSSNSSTIHDGLDTNVKSKSKSKSQLIDAMKSVRREIDHDEISAQEQREVTMRRDAQRDIMKKSSKHTSKIVKATNKALQKRTARPKFSLGAASTTSHSRSSREARMTRIVPRLSHSGQVKSGLAEAKASSYIPRLGVKRSSDMRTFMNKKK